VAAELTVISAEHLSRRLHSLEPIGLRPEGTTRLAWTAEDEAAGAWFAEQAAECGLLVQRDPAGNRWAVPDAPPPWWGCGSHLDSVRAGGRYDGALGMCAAFEVARQTSAPIAVVAFADEEGARFNTPTFGSRALIGRLDIDDVLTRRDDAGVSLADAMAAAGVDPQGLRRAPEWLPRLRGFLELHVDQTPDLERYAVVRGLAARLRVQADLDGRADHSGTTRRAERRDALLAAARLIIAADDLADEEMVTTASRILVEPNALTTIAAHVRLWLDARASRPEPLDHWLETLRQQAATARLQVASRSDGVVFDAAVRAALGDPGGVLCFAGHDAGILAERIPAGMVLTRNPSGISHSPQEEADLDAAASGAGTVAHALEMLA
jgi:beta-ureidopropionase / N-carbamoyl-L-amino-acid hydrolase